MWCRKGGGGREFNSRFSELLLQASVSNLCFIARLSARALVWELFFILVRIQLIFRRRVLHMRTLHPPPRSNPDGDVCRRTYRKKNGGEGSGESFTFFLFFSDPSLFTLFFWSARTLPQKRASSQPVRDLGTPPFLYNSWCFIPPMPGLHLIPSAKLTLTH